LYSLLRYPLVIHRQFDILQSGTGWRKSNAIRPTEMSQVHHAHRRRGDSQYAARDPGKGWFRHFRFYAPKEVNFADRGAIWISENS
jgi:hypothetical protein